MNTSIDKSKERENSPSWIKQVPRTKSKPGWQIARDISMDKLSKESPALSFNRSTHDNFF
jgi:hypothetical protein